MRKKIIIIAVIALILFLPIFVFANSEIASILKEKGIKGAIEYLSGRIDKISSEQENIKSIQCDILDNAITNAQLKGGIIDADIKTFEQLIDKINSNIASSPEEAKAMWQERLSEVQKMKGNFEEAKKRCQ
jgi:peptidoglycan hydrolase CwlO-like protein